MPLGFIGLGHLGRAIAQHLIESGEELVVYNRTMSKADGLKAKRAESVSAVAVDCSTIILCLFDSKAVAEVLPIILANRQERRMVIDLTTNHHRGVLDFHRECGSVGGEYIEAPVLGSVVPASRGELTVLVSGSDAAYQSAKPVLEKIGKTIHFLREPGNATRMKLINNHLLGTFMAAIAEAIKLSESAGVSREQAIAILSTGAGNSGVFNAKREKLINDDYAPHFSAALIQKDLGYLLELADEVGQEALLARATKKLFDRTMSDEPHDRDFSAIINYLK